MKGFPSLKTQQIKKMQSCLSDQLNPSLSNKLDKIHNSLRGNLSLLNDFLDIK
jgi:hypothetical protein